MKPNIENLIEPSDIQLSVYFTIKLDSKKLYVRWKRFNNGPFNLIPIGKYDESDSILTLQAV